MKQDAVDMMIQNYRAGIRAARNAELAKRLEVPLSTEDMILALHMLDGLNVAEREAEHIREFAF